MGKLHAVKKDAELPDSCPFAAQETDSEHEIELPAGGGGKRGGADRDRMSLRRAV